MLNIYDRLKKPCDSYDIFIEELRRNLNSNEFDLSKNFRFCFDVDGTLSDDSVRANKYLSQKELKQWDKYFSDCYQDTVLQSPLIEFIQRHIVPVDAAVSILTGRPETTLDHTRFWLYDNLKIRNFNAMLFRPVGDYRPNTELKIFHLRRIIESGEKRPIVVFDDNIDLIRYASDRMRGVLGIHVNHREGKQPTLDIY